MTIHRRVFVARALVACGAAIVAPVALRARDGIGQTEPSARAARVAVAYFAGRTDTARTVGATYLRQLGAATSQNEVLNATRDTRTLIDRAAGQGEAIAALENAIADDYRRGRSVQGDGWVLSQTEAEVCALTLLSPAS